MLKFVLKKIALMVPMLLAISLIVFLGLRSTGIDPITYMVSMEVQAQSPELVAQLRESLGLNDPILVQYVRWLGNLLAGNLGYNFEGQSIASIISVRLPYTLELSAYALLFSSIIGIAIGVISAIRQNGAIDYIGRVLAVLGQAVPQFLAGIILLQIFAVRLGLFPSSGRVSPGAESAFIDGFLHLFLPVLTLTIGMVAVLTRYARNTMLDVLNSDYIRTARSKGIPEWKVYLKHGFRNAMKPVLIIIMFRIPVLVGGSVVIETVFSYPGIGRTMTNAIVSNDYPTVMIITLVIAAVMLVASFMVDVFNALLDPRIRLGE